MFARLSIYFIFLLLVSASALTAQTTIFLEDFNALSDGAMSGANWAVDQFNNCETPDDTSYEFNVISGAFRINDVEGNCGCPNGSVGDNNNTMSFGEVDIASYCEVYVDLNYSATGGFQCADGGTKPPTYCALTIPETGRDMLFVEAIVDGVSTTLLYVCGDSEITNNLGNPLPTGNTIIISITGGTTANAEYYDLDDIGIYGTPKPDPPTIDVTGNTSICNGESVTLTVQGSGPYSWGHGPNDQSIIVFPITTTNYTVTTGTGCTLGSANQLITVFANPIANAGSDVTICVGEETTLTAAEGGSSYAWTDGLNGRSVLVSPPATTTYTVTVTAGPGCKDTDDVKVSVTDLPLITTNSDQTVCQGESITLTAMGAESYLWSNDMTGPSINFEPTSTQIYSVIGTANGCEGTAQVSVTVNPNPTAGISGDDNICKGEVTTLLGSGSGDYIWSTDQTSNSIDITPETTSTYSLSITDNGCTDIATYEIIVAPNPIADAGPDETICDGDLLTLTAEGGTSYQWSTGSSSQGINVNPTADISYSVTVTDGICSDTDEVNVSVIALPSADISGDLTICQGASTILNAVGSGTYNWSTNETGPSIEVSPTSTTNYTLTVTDNGCSQNATKTVKVTPLPAIDAGSDITVCEDGTVTLNATGADSYMWNDGQSGPSIMVSPTSELSLIVTGTLNNCSATDTVAISIQSKITANAGVDQEICNGTEALLSAAGGSSYEWTAGSGNDIQVSPSTTTIYTVTATDGVCMDTDDVEIKVTEPFVLESTPDTTICAGSTVQLSLVAPIEVSYNWSTSENTANINVQPSLLTTYSATVTDGICDVTEEIKVDIDDINVNLETDGSEICLGSSVDIEVFSNGAILWSDGSTENTRIFIPSMDTTILVEATSVLGCKASDQLIISLNPLPTLGIDGQPYYCDGSATNISASDGLSAYLWSDGNNDQHRTIDISGTYTVIGTDEKGCMNGASIIVEQKELPEPIILGSKTYCPGSSTELSIDQTYESQQWNLNGDISTNSTYTVDSDGSVNLEVTDLFGCVGSIDAIIESNPDLNPVISGDKTLCENTIGELDAGNGFDNYEWSTGDTTSTIEITEGIAYSVSVFTDDGCSGSTSLVVDLVPNPIVSIIGDLAFCENLATTLFIPEYSNIQWSTGASTESIDVSAPGSIRVDIIDENGCTAFDEVEIAENPNPNPVIAGELVYCENGSTELTVSSDYRSVIWSNGVSDQSIVVDAAGAYDVTVEDMNGCANDTQVTVIENANPTPQIIAPSIICENTETKIYTAESYSSYFWSIDIQTDTQTIINSGLFEIMVADNNGCHGTDAIRIDEATAPIIEFKSEMIFCNTKIDVREEPLSIDLDTAFTTKNVDGTWSTLATNLDLSSLPILSFEGVQPGIYEFTYTSTNATAPCEDISRTVTLKVLDCQCPNVQFQPIDPLCSLSGMLDLSGIQSSDFEGSWQVVEGPSTTFPSIDNDMFNAMNQMAGAYVIEFRLEDGIAPLGCDESKTINLEVLEHIDASIELVNPACGDNEATFRVNFSGGGSLYDVDILQDDGQMISLDDIPDGHTFDLALSGTTDLSFSNVSGNLPSCGFESLAPTYTFAPSPVEAQVNLAKNYGDFGVSCNESADGSAIVEIQSGTAPYTYSWSNGATTAMIDNLPSGEYNVSVQDAIGCEFISSIDIIPPPIKQIEIETEDPRCGQGPGKLLLNTIPGITDGGWEFYIDGVLRSENKVPVILNNLEPGAHLFEAVNEQGCLEDHSFTIMDDSAFAINIEDITVNLGESTFLHADFNFDYESILWSPSIYLNYSSSRTVLLQQPLNGTTYTITVNDVNGCVFSETVRVNVEKERSLAIPTGFTPNGDSNNDAFIIHAKSNVALINSVSVFDRWGEEVFTKDNVVPNQPIEWDWTYKNQPLPYGQYVWRANAIFIDNVDVDFSGKFYILR